MLIQIMRCSFPVRPNSNRVLSGVTVTGAAFGPTIGSGWTLVATPEFNADGGPDFLLYNAATRQTAIWYLNNNVYIGSASGRTLPVGWSLLGA